MKRRASAFTPDLRSPVPGDASEGAWSKRALIEHFFGDHAAFVLGAVGKRRKLRVLEVGCGYGFLALELARAGHDVTAIDPSRDAIAVARRTAKRAARSVRGTLAFERKPFGEFRAPAASFDAIVFCRSLHHVPDLEPTLERVRSMLVPRGRVVCSEHGWDLLDAKTARWRQSVVRELHASGHYAEPAQRAPQFLRKWKHHAKGEGLHRFEPMVASLRACFREEKLSRVPYLYGSICAGLRNMTDEQEDETVREVKALERRLARSGAIRAAGFRFVGRR